MHLIDNRCQAVDGYGTQRGVVMAELSFRRTLFVRWGNDAVGVG